MSQRTKGVTWWIQKLFTWRCLSNGLKRGLVSSLAFFSPPSQLSRLLSLSLLQSLAPPLKSRLQLLFLLIKTGGRRRYCHTKLNEPARVRSIAHKKIYLKFASNTTILLLFCVRLFHEKTCENETCLFTFKNYVNFCWTFNYSVLVLTVLDCVGLRRNTWKICHFWIILIYN